MGKLWLVIAAGCLALAPAAAQHDPRGRDDLYLYEAAAAADTIVLQISGLACEACPAAVERGLKKVLGVRKARVSRADGLAEIKVRGYRASPKRLAQAVAANEPPQAGTGFKAALLLQVRGLRRQGDADRLTEALEEVAGVERAEVRRTPGIAVVSFGGNRDVQLADLAAAAEEEGFTVAPLSLREARKVMAGSGGATTRPKDGSTGRADGRCTCDR